MDLLIHLLKANLVFVLLWGAHRWLTRKQLLDHRWERGFWLLVPVLAFTLPLLRLPAAEVLPVVQWVPPVQVGATSGAAAAVPVTRSWSITELLVLLQGAGMLVAFVLLLLRYHRAWRNMEVGGEACSFFRRVILPESITGEDRTAMEAHEQVHVRAGHSYDVLYYELLRVISWWNPAWTAARNSLQQAHEWAADAEAATHHSDYARLLVARALGVPSSSLVNAFTSTNIRTRITMLNKERHPKHPLLRYMVFLPVLGLAALVACTKADAPPAQPTAQIPDASSSIQAVPETEVQISEVDVQPEFPGGMEALIAFLQSELKVPEEMLPARTEQPKIYMHFTVAKDGSVQDVKVRRGLRADLDQHVVEVFERMPKWKPAEKDGKVVPVRFTMPVNYAAAVAK